ncbi:MAG: Ldh family oxidoreductase [Ahrensia sp.]|nr:Ldh family oxidoreductase [Ahrensia sp.]
MPRMTPDEIRQLIADALIRSNTSKDNALSVAEALLAAELAGQSGHGLRRVESYAAQSASGKVDGHAVPTFERAAPSVLHVDAMHSFAYPALDLVQQHLPDMAREQGIAIAGISRSHHCGVMGVVVEVYAKAGLVALMFANTPAAMAPWGGSKAVFGTNPLAFAAPRAEGAPIVVDVSLSKVARGKIMAAKQKGDTIPKDWAFDAKGEPTSDPVAALSGTMAPLGDAKGTALALMVELLAAGLTGANFASEASSFFDAEGAPPGVGQTIIAIDPHKLGGDAVLDRFVALAAMIEEQPGARVPGARRAQLRDTLAVDGIEIEADLAATIEAIGR